MRRTVKINVTESSRNGNPQLFQF